MSKTRTVAPVASGPPPPTQKSKEKDNVVLSLEQRIQRLEDLDTPILAAVKTKIGVKEAPKPFNLKNPQVFKELLWSVAYCDMQDVTKQDVFAKWGGDGDLVDLISKNIDEVYLLDKNASLNTWQSKMKKRMILVFKTAIRLYAALPESLEATQFIEEFEELNAMYTELVDDMDDDYIDKTSKKAGRVAEMASSLDTAKFPQRRGWVLRKAMGKSE